MVTVNYPQRILADEGFVEWLIKRSDREFYFMKLTHIKCSSLHYKKEHNLVLQEEFEKIVKSGTIKDITLKEAFKPTILPAEISSKVQSPIDQKIIFSMVLANLPPYKTFIFTTRTNLQTYLQSPHYTNVKTVSIKSEEDALRVIDSLFRLFCMEKDH